MKSLKQHIEEGLRIGINDNPYTASPTTWDELRQIIEQRFEELGPGTAQEPIDFNDVDVSGITSFYGERSLDGIFEDMRFEYIDVSEWDVSNVTNMHCTFYNCTLLKELDVSKWNVSKVEDMSGMFLLCENLKELDLSNWNVSNVENMQDMFSQSSLEKLNLSNWDVSKVEKNMFGMHNMFWQCYEKIIPRWYKK